MEQLVRTTKGTVRFISEDDMYIKDYDIGIVNVYKFLNIEQRDDLYMWASTVITPKQKENILNYIII